MLKQDNAAREGRRQAKLRRAIYPVKGRVMAQSTRNTAKHWNAYWKSADANQGAVSGDAPGDLFEKSWRDFFDREISHRSDVSVADLACGAGVVLKRAAATITELNKDADLCCGVDYAHAAAADVSDSLNPSDRRSFRISGIVSDVGQLPFPDACFDLVTSQFGIEYAGAGAFSEAGRILAPDGAAQLIAHYKDGSIYAECGENAHILGAVLQSNLFGAARDLFSAANVQAARDELSRTIIALKPELSGEPLMAKVLAARLLGDMERIMVRHRAFAPGEIIAWLDAMRLELEQYAARMRAMMESALDEGEVGQIVAQSSAMGLECETPAEMTTKKNAAPAAWLLVMRRAPL